MVHHGCITSPDLWPRWDPTEVLLTQLQTESEECEQSTHQINAQNSPADYLEVMKIERYSTLQKLLAVTAYVLRFVNTTRSIASINTKHLTKSELFKGQVEMDTHCST